MASTFASAQTIVACTHETLELIPTRFRHKSIVNRAIGIEPELVTAPSNEGAACPKRRGLRLLFVGRFLYWKGMEVGLRAFAELVRRDPQSQLTMAGSGPSCSTWTRLTRRLRISERVDWIEWLPRDDLLAYYRNHDLLLFPSLHDSGGWVVLEALANGVPIVCLGIGGPAMLVDDSCGRVVNVDQRSAVEVKEEIARHLIELNDDSKMLAQLSAGAVERAKQLTWERTVSELYAQITKKMVCSESLRRDG